MLRCIASRRSELLTSTMTSFNNDSLKESTKNCVGPFFVIVLNLEDENGKKSTDFSTLCSALGVTFDMCAI